MALNPSGEMYLESIYLLCASKSFVRSVDVAEHMNFSKPSVSRAIGLLKKQGFLVLDESGHIFLTPQGEAHAKKIYERHTLITRALVRLGVEEKTASEDACKIEHVIGDESFRALKKHMKQFD